MQIQYQLIHQLLIIYKDNVIQIQDLTHMILVHIKILFKYLELILVYGQFQYQFNQHKKEMGLHGRRIFEQNNIDLIIYELFFLSYIFIAIFSSILLVIFLSISSKSNHKIQIKVSESDKYRLKMRDLFRYYLKYKNLLKL